MGEGLYRTIVADPPWRYDDGFAGGHSRTPGKWESPVIQQSLPYPSLSVAAISALPVVSLAADNCRLFLWTTNRYLADAFYILRVWGFRYRQTLVWHKTDVNLPASIAPNSAEFVLVGVKGAPRRLAYMPSAVIASARGKRHSKKPEYWQALFEQVSPGPYLELFARRPRVGWSVWGNEVESDIELRAA